MKGAAAIVPLTEVLSNESWRAEVDSRVARGSILAIPTESSYGLGVDPRNAAGVAAVYRVKSREAAKPLPVVIADLDQLPLLGIDAAEPRLRSLAGLWPAPLSCLFPTRSTLPASAGASTLAVRIPAHPGLRALLSRLGRPLTATSANLAGEPPMLEAGEVAELLADQDALVLDGGQLAGGPPSTLIAPDGPGLACRLLRAGAFDPDILVRAGLLHPRENP